MRNHMFCLSFWALLLPSAVFSQPETLGLPQTEIRLATRYSCGKTCGRVSSCEEAVYQWCVCNYQRADGDNDGVPCEKLCGQSTAANRSRVNRIKAKLGCR